MKFHLSLSELIKSDAKLKIIKFLLTHEAAMSEREIASVLHISHMGINRTMQELADLNLVDYTVVGKAHLWKVNRNSFAYRMLEKLIKNTEAWIDPKIELKQMILKNLPLKLIKKISIFGSIAENSEKANSDIDLFILVNSADKVETIENSLEQLSIKCLETFGNRLSPYILTEQQFKQKANLKIMPNLQKGIEVYPNGKAKNGA